MGELIWNRYNTLLIYIIYIVEKLIKRHSAAVIELGVAMNINVQLLINASIYAYNFIFDRCSWYLNYPLRVFHLAALTGL